MIEEIVAEHFGSWWIASIRALGILSGSVYPRETVERRLGGAPVYIGDESDHQDEIITTNHEWKQAGGSRIVASKIISHAESLVGHRWQAVVLAYCDDHAERAKAAKEYGMMMSAYSLYSPDYCICVCNRWGEKRFMHRYEGAVSREYRIAYSHTVADLIKLSGKGERTEIKRRSEIMQWLNDDLSVAMDILERE